jgi:hypothetical protein
MDLSQLDKGRAQFLECFPQLLLLSYEENLRGPLS